jgi:hypothetical protein
VASLSPYPNPNLEDQALYSVWPLSFDLSGKNGPTMSLCSRHRSSSGVEFLFKYFHQIYNLIGYRHERKTFRINKITGIDETVKQSATRKSDINFGVLATVIMNIIVFVTLCRTPTEKMEKIQLIGSSSPYESNRASPTIGRRPLPFKRDLMGLSLSSLSCRVAV